MITFLQFVLLGLGTGAAYALSAKGLVLVYRGSGVLNFAHGGVGIAAAYLAWELNERHGVAWPLSFLISVVAAALCGIAIHWLIMRRLRTASSLVRVVATLGVLILIQGLIGNRYQGNIYSVRSWLPTDIISLGGGVTVTLDRLLLLALAAALTVTLWAVYRFTMFGLATTAVAENERAAASLGWSYDFVASLNWGLGSALAGAAGILLAPITALSVGAMTTFMLATVAAALVGSFRSFSMTMAAGLALGVLETVIGYYSRNWGDWSTGLSSSIPFFIIVALSVVRGRALPLRDFFLERPPVVGSGRVRPVLLAVLTVLAVLAISQFDATWADAATTSFAVALILLSIVVLTGYTGQISLAQFAVAGAGAFIAAKLTSSAGLPFVPAAALAIALTVPIGTMFALPAVRTRGINLAIVTLGLGSAIQFMLFANDNYTGGEFGISVGSPTLFGWSIDAILHPNRYAALCFVAFVVAAVLVSNIRRGRTGRRLLAVRTNERAAAALGISAVTVKLYAFSVAAGIAALGGILLNFRNPDVLFMGMSNSLSITYVGLAVIGGVGFLLGPVQGSLLAAGSLGAAVVESLFGATVASYLHVFGGAVLILLIFAEPNGLARGSVAQGHAIERLVSRFLRKQTKSDASATSEGPAGRVQPRELEVQNLTVKYGNVVACDNISLRVAPGQVVGLIGPNGAGKTTLIDAISGFVRPTSGHILLDGTDVTGLSAVRRARAGMSRSFQSLELFEDMTVGDNLRAASEPQDLKAGVTDLVFPVIRPLSASATAAVQEFKLGPSLAHTVDSLSYGERRLLAAARAVATEPSILLLDECAAGLSEGETRELGHLVRRLADNWGIGVLVIEHDVNFVMNTCDYVVVLDFGKVISEGVPAEVRRDPAVIAAYLGEGDDGQEEAIKSPFSPLPR